MRNFPIYILLVILLFSACKKQDEITNYEQKFNIKILTAEQLAKIIYSSDSSMVFIDIRNPHQFRNGHLKNAINIPSKYAFDKKYKDIWHSKDVKIIYGNNNSDAVLLGYWASYNNIPNVFVALGGYDYFKNNIIDNYAIYSGIYDAEKPLFDYKQVMAELGSSSSKPTDNQTITQPVVNVPVVQNTGGEEGGGCE